MADAKPSRPGVNPTGGNLEINIPKDVKIVKKDDGEVVRRTEFAGGTIRETNVFPGDHKDAKPLPKPKAEPKGKAKDGE